MSAEFTQQESEYLGEVFPDGLLTKVGVVIRDAILAIIAEQKTSLLDDPRLDVRIQAAIEAATNGIANQISDGIDQKLRDPSFITNLAYALAGSEEACARLNSSLEQCRRKRLDEAAIRRHENLTAAAIKFYTERQPDTQLSKESVRALVERLDADNVVKGLQPSQYNERVAKAIFTKEVEMVTFITGICKIKTPKGVIENNAALLVLEGLPLEASTVRKRLEVEEDIASHLKKT